MTDQLKDLLTRRADDVDFAVPDLGAITTAGDRRLRWRRATRVGAGVLAVALVGSGVGVAALRRGGGDHAVDPASDGLSVAGRVTWVTGSVLHTPDESVDLGHPVAAYVQTTVGIVYADDDGAVWSWTADAGSTEVGHVGKRVDLVVGGSRAGWLDDAADTPRIVVLDQGTGRTESDAVLGDGDAKLAVYAIDGGVTYVQDRDGVVALDLHDGSGPVIAPAGTTVLAAEGGLIAFGSDDTHTTRLGRTLDDATPIPDSYSGVGELSPGGRWFNGDADAPQVTDTTTLQPVSLNLPQTDFADGYRWLDADDLAVMWSSGDDGDLVLYRCHVPDGTCDKVVGPGTMADYGSGKVLLPLGVPLSD